MSLIFGSFQILSPISLASALVALLITIWYSFFKKRGLPPGPVGLPYLGYWPFLKDADCHLKLEEMKNKYGHIFCFTSSGRLYVIMGCIQIAREAFSTKSDCFGERFSDFSLMNYIFKNGIGLLKEEPWKAVRKFLLRFLKERIAITIKNSTSESLYDIIRSTVRDLKAKKGAPVNLTDLLTHKCNSVLRLILFNEVGATEEQIRKFCKLYATEMGHVSPTNMFLSGTIARYFIFPLKPEYRKIMKCHKQMENILFEIVEEHKLTYDEENVRDIIDEYFKERDEKRRKGDPAAQFFTDETLIGTLIQIVGDGVFGVTSFISLWMKKLVEHPKEQERLYQEVMDIIGSDRQPNIEDKSKLTYYNALISEVMRTSDFFTLFPSLECIKETTIGEYRIPKGSVMVLNFYSAHRDPEIYKEPDKFNPSRFMQTDGIKRPEQPITFGIGKQSCLGESYAMLQAFLFMTTIVQNFRLELPKDTIATSYEQYMSGKFLICAHPRDQMNN
ncbi:cytochrome P450 2A9 [Nephila pilipes]|uniref:Cytochrome P450 2A9 n=1 Tax=Nephila pilipes TaxID=299642 RepID=A0A8X6N056_NEPPI|nr:cytochrome P450 2A9 [Nephila pilipes]